jgi:flagellar basal body-associated protein FliL
MSEEATPTPTKKKGKLPIIIVLLLVIVGGGFFAMKSKGGPPKVEVKPGECAALDKEFLVNLAGGANIYLRAELAVELREGFTKESLDPQLPAIRDSINQIFRSKSPQEVGASETADLQKEIATAINSILVSHMAEDAKKKQAEFEKAVAEKKPDADKKKPKDADERLADCPAGPVINVYFTSFTTQ